MLQNYCDLEKKLIDNYDTSQETSLSSLSNIGSNTTSDLTCFADCQTYIQQQKQLIQQIHKQEKKLKHIKDITLKNFKKDMDVPALDFIYAPDELKADKEVVLEAVKRMVML